MLSAQRRRVIGLLCILTGLCVIFAQRFDWNDLKPYVEQTVSQQTGREFRIDGDLRVVLSWPPRFRMEQVRFANPEWAAQPQMLRAEAANFTLEIDSLLLHRRLVFPDVRVIKPVIDMEISRDGRNNWTLGAPDDGKKGGGTVPEIGKLRIDEGRLTFRDNTRRLLLHVNAATTADAQGVLFGVKGQYKGLPVEAKGGGGSILSIRDTRQPYPLHGRFRVGATQGSIGGTITGLAALTAVKVRLDVGGESFAELYPLIGVSLPPTPPYRVKGLLVRKGDHWLFHNFEGRVGDSDLSGTADVVYRAHRAKVVADLTSNLLDLDDLGGVIGAPPQTGAGETASAKQKQQAAALDTKATVLPDDPYHLEKFRAMDADIKFRGKAIRGREQPIDDLEFHAILERGVLKANPLNFGIAGGNVVSWIVVDARRQQLDGSGDVHFNQIHLDKLFPQFQMLKTTVGVVGGRALLKSQGNTFAELLAHADGNIGLAMNGGQISNLLLELAGLDAWETVKYLLTGDRTVQLRCAVADFDVKSGVLRTRSAFVDTTDTNVHLNGSVDLRNEGLNLTLDPKPKDVSPLSLRSPLHLRGSFKKPAVSLDKEAFVKAGIAAALSAVVAPIAALLPMFETGPGKDADCGAAVTAVEQRLRTRIPGTR